MIRNSSSLSASISLDFLAVLCGNIARFMPRSDEAD